MDPETARATARELAAALARAGAPSDDLLVGEHGTRRVGKHNRRRTKYVEFDDRVELISGWRVGRYFDKQQRDDHGGAPWKDFVDELWLSESGDLVEVQLCEVTSFGPMSYSVTYIFPPQIASDNTLSNFDNRDGMYYSLRLEHGLSSIREEHLPPGTPATATPVQASPNATHSASPTVEQQSGRSADSDWRNRIEEMRADHTTPRSDQGRDAIVIWVLFVVLTLIGILVVVKNQ